jgi:hypothetical protein
LQLFTSSGPGAWPIGYLVDSSPPRKPGLPHQGIKSAKIHGFAASNWSRVATATARAACAKSLPAEAYSTARDEFTTMGATVSPPARA